MPLNAVQEPLQTDFDPKQYWENRLNTNLSLKGVGFSMLGRQYNQWLYKLRTKILQRELARLKLDLSRSSVLDVGSGVGFYINFWKNFGVKSVSGCDLTEISVSYLREQFPEDAFYQLDVGESISEELNAKFDVVSAFDILFHIVDDERLEQAVRNVSKILKSNGIFCFSDSFLHRPTERGVHQVNRSLSYFEKLIRENGFEIISRRPVFVLMNEPHDTTHASLKFLWRLFMYPVGKSEMFGAFWGMGLYPLDLFLTKILNESPTTEIMFCRKVK